MTGWDTTGLSTRATRRTRQLFSMMWTKESEYTSSLFLPYGVAHLELSWNESQLKMVFGSVLLASIVMVSLVSVGVAFEVDATDSVTRVVDGDTFDTSANGRVRLADVDSPESYEPGFDGATDALAGMVGGRLGV